MTYDFSCVYYRRLTTDYPLLTSRCSVLRLGTGSRLPRAARDAWRVRTSWHVESSGRIASESTDERRVGSRCSGVVSSRLRRRCCDAESESCSVSNETSDMTGSILYVYAPAAAAPKVAAGSKKIKVEPGKKQKREEESDDDDNDEEEDDMAWACEVAAMRMLKKLKKETLVAICTGVGIPTSGNKEKLAEDAAEQMHYETDDESDDDE